MQRFLRFLVLVLATSSFVDATQLTMPSGMLAAQELPSQDAGEKVTEQVCSGCHGVDFFAGKRMTRQMWRLTIEDMFGRGAVGTEEQFEQIVSYLSAYRGETIKVNEADARQFGQVLDIPLSQAQAIVDFRAANGEFSGPEDLRRVPGLDPARVDEQRLNLSFE